MTKRQFEAQDTVLVYQGDTSYQDGAVCKVLDYDPHNNSYLVVELGDIARAKEDTIKMYEMYSHWVNPDYMEKLSFEKTKPLVRREFLCALFVAVLIAAGVYFEQFI